MPTPKIPKNCEEGREGGTFYARSVQDYIRNPTKKMALPVMFSEVKGRSLEHICEPNPYKSKSEKKLTMFTTYLKGKFCAPHILVQLF